MNVINVNSGGTLNGVGGSSFGHGGGGPGGAHGKGLGDLVAKYIEHAMSDGKLDRKEAKTLERLVKAEENRSNGCDDKKKCDEKNKCEDKEDKNDCGKSDDKLVEQYIKTAMKDGKLSRMESKVIDRLLDSAGDSRFA